MKKNVKDFILSAFAVLFTVLMIVHFNVVQNANNWGLINRPCINISIAFYVAVLFYDAFVAAIWIIKAIHYFKHKKSN